MNCPKCKLPLNADHVHRTYEEHDACRNSPLPASPVADKLELCDTTMTPRAPRTACGCNTYPENLGCCATFELGSNGNCAYCDHNPSCHRAHFGYAASPVAEGESQMTHKEFWFQNVRPIINAIGEISVQEAMDAVERGLETKWTS